MKWNESDFYFGNYLFNRKDDRGVYRYYSAQTGEFIGEIDLMVALSLISAVSRPALGTRG